MKNRFKTHYKTLGVYVVAEMDYISEMFKELAKKHHPDKGGDLEKFTELSVAYSVLKNPKSREAYDAMLKRDCIPCPKCDGKGATIRMKITEHKAVLCDGCKGAGYGGYKRKERKGL